MEDDSQLLPLASSNAFLKASLGVAPIEFAVVIHDKLVSLSEKFPVGVMLGSSAKIG